MEVIETRCHTPLCCNTGWE